MDRQNDKRAPPRVVVVGCGFGGLFAVRALKRSPVDVLVIDRNNYHLFQPLLYQIASAALTPADIAQPIRRILRNQRNANVMLGEVKRVALDERRVYVDTSPVAYDYLILAPGAVDNYFGHEEWREYAPGMKEIEEAIQIRSRLLLSFEAAEIEADSEERAAHLTFVIVGGGPTGVELAGAIKELAVDVIAQDFRFTDMRKARVVLIEASDRLLPAFHPESSRRALEQLRELGVEVRLGQPVTRVLPDGVEREYRLEFPWMLDGTEQDRMRVLHAGHRRKLSKLLRRKLRTERVRMLPAETLLLLRWRWAQRRGIRFTLRKALAYYLRYRMLDRCLTKNGHGALYGLYDEQGELLSVAYMLESPGTAFYMLGASSAAGYRIGASIRLFWDLAERYAERRLRYLSLGGVPAEAVEASHPEHGVYRFKSEFGIEPVRRVSLTCRGWGRA